MADKECCHDEDESKLLQWGTVGAVMLFIVVAVILLVWVILRPTKPKFRLQDATVYALNVSNAPNDVLTTSFQVSLSSRNPNDLIGVYYDSLQVHARYRHEQITQQTSLPTAYQGHRDVSLWSSFLFGADIPVSPDLTLLLAQDQAAGLLLLNIIIHGRVRWKVASWISGTYHLSVNCPACITFPTATVFSASPNFKYQFPTKCHVDV